MLHRKMTTLPKGTDIDTGNLRPREIIHMDFAFYNVTFIHGFTSIPTIVCEKNRMIWLLPTASKWYPLRIIIFVLTTLKNKQHPWKYVRVDEDHAIDKSADITNLLVDKFRNSMENTDVDASWINGNNERHNRIIHKMVRTGIFDSNQHANKCCREAETSTEVHQ